jgi:hypothetical protein
MIQFSGKTLFGPPAAVQMPRSGRRYAERGLNVEVSGLHLLLTYQCSLECEHCFENALERLNVSTLERSVPFSSLVVSSRSW